MKRYWTVCAACLCLASTLFGQPGQSGWSGISPSDTSQVCLTIQQARWAAIELERYDRLKLEVAALNEVIESLREEIAVWELKSEVLSLGNEALIRELELQVESAEGWREKAEKRGKGMGVLAALVLGVLILK